MSPLADHPAPLLLPCVRCYHAEACAWYMTAQAEGCDGFEEDHEDAGGCRARGVAGGGVMAKWRKKPVVVEAFRWTGGPDQDEDPVWMVDAIRDGRARITNTLETIALFEVPGPIRHLAGRPGNEARMIIKTLEGDHMAMPGDYIIKGIRGELYPCKPDIFEATYEPEE